MDGFTLVSGFFVLFCIVECSSGLDAIAQDQSISEGRRLTSKNGSFELGFYSPSNSTVRFLGIWHKKIPLRKLVWVANQNNPINDSSGLLTINTEGNALLLGHTNSVFWSTNSSKRAPKPILQLLDSGKLVLRDEKDENPDNYLWQSFELDHQMGTFLKGTTLGRGRSAMADSCDDYGRCGPSGLCDISNSPICSCPKGFKPKSPEQWSTGENSQGCVRNIPLDCEQSNGFIEYISFKVQDTQNSSVDKSMNLKECREKCLRNCSCMAYASAEINGGGGCTIWFGELIGIRRFVDGGHNLFVKMPASELDTKHGKKVKIIVGITVTASISITFGILLAVYYKRRNRTEFKENDRNDEAQKEDLDLPSFNLSTIATATVNFSSNNKLGDGGFGSVYMGTLPDGQVIAAKRLSLGSGQGMNEFKNEVILIAKLQHRNLVRLLGYCIQGEERLLIYEYMPNKSLDYYIFDQTRGKLLDWSKRFNIILGVARGLIYLHQDSRLRIIHRDLKASNVLLDKVMNPKISDFGMARTFRGDQTEGVTNRVVGTFGYMAPEYAIDGQFSVKSDVFSFGILMLEIVSGKRNRGFYNPSDNINLIGHAWRLWKEGRELELIDESIHGDSCTLLEVLRCMHVGLLCVQLLPEDRPTMSSVLLMLGDGNALPQPKEPIFFLGKNSSEASTSTSAKQDTSSTNDFSLSLVHAR
ncbi:Mitogen-activated protein kinase kinase kinase [Parasponia andersonii]|uniref:Receptor-like serine/threonine-protein kinase n=1 Tax=Parasponia andersonii TaxID=3476 RepID=A0A2P5BMD0_PARAD|nr:Mitogen-activated protein kinase kinase kinase [Parasponia andersonii]